MSDSPERAEDPGRHGNGAQPASPTPPPSSLGTSSLPPVTSQPVAVPEPEPERQRLIVPDSPVVPGHAEESEPAPELLAELPPRLAPPRRSLATYSPFRLGLTAAIGFGFAYVLFRGLQRGEDTFLLLLLALFLAAGLDPAVRRVQSLGLGRGLSVAVVFVSGLLLLVGFGFAILPPLVEQTATFVHNLPGYVTELQHNRRIADLDRRFGLLDRVQSYLNGSELLKRLGGNLISVGTAIASTIFQVFSLAVLTLYFLSFFDDITGFAYRLTPASRRPAARRIGDKIIAQIGHYVGGTVCLALLRGVFTLAFLAILRVPYPFALAFIAAVLDIAPVVGAVLAAVVVTTVVALESVPSGIAVICFFVAYEVLARLVFVPRLLDKSVRVNPAAAVIGALAGFTLFGVIGFLISIPLVAVITLILREVLLPRQAAR